VLSVIIVNYISGEFLKDGVQSVWIVGAGVWIRFNVIMISHGVKHLKQWGWHGHT